MDKYQQPVVDFSNVFKSFGDVRALHGISFELQSGEAFAILGHNGAGKTTAIRLILGLFKPDQGFIRLLGHDPYPEKEPIRELRQQIGVVQEEDRLYLRMSGEENLEFWLALYGKRKAADKKQVFSALEWVGLENKAQVKVGTYSKGMRRRLAIARALILEPQLLILDEPTVGLDPEARVEVRELLERLIQSEGLTLLMTSHDLDEVEKLCERLIVIDHGQILLSGTLPELQAGQQPQLFINFLHGGDEPISDALLKGLNALPFVAQLALTDSELVLTLNQNDPELISQVVTRLAKGGVGIAKVELRQRSLEEIYLQAINGRARNESHEKQ